mgnify:CR=1 FL=1
MMMQSTASIAARRCSLAIAEAWHQKRSAELLGVWTRHYTYWVGDLSLSYVSVIPLKLRFNIYDELCN